MPLSRLATWTLPSALLALASCLSAQSDQSPPGTVITHHQILITGCLKRSSEPGGYYITDANGKTWQLFSQDINLAQHVFHSVTITGKEAPLPSQSNDKNKQGEASSPPAGLRVLTLKMLSPSCTR